MRVSFSLASLALTVAGVSAYDLRELYSFKGGDGVAFCKAWKCACINYEPADTNVFFLSAGCQPGDYSGSNKDTQALASCAFTTDGHVPIPFSDDVAQEIGATLV